MKQGQKHTIRTENVAPQCNSVVIDFLKNAEKN